MATVRLIPDTRAKKDGSQMILLVIRIGKTRFVFSTGISTPSSEKFNEVSYLDKSVPQSKVKNVRLVSLKNKAEKLIIDDEARLSSLPSAKAKEIISEYVFDEKVVKKTRCFIDYLDEFVSINMIIPVIMPPHIAGMKFQNDIFFICEISRFMISCCAINLTNSLSYSFISNWFICKDTIIQ